MQRWDDDEAYELEESYGQGDGEPVAAAFVPTQLGQPWLRPSQPPWHMWGSSEIVTVVSGAPFTPPTNATQQLTKVAYKRPETWHWLFFARLVEAPDAGALQQGSITVNFDVMVGLGRSSVQLIQFENLHWEWGPSAGAPLSTLLYSTSSIGPNRSSGGGVVAANLINELVAENIQVQARVSNGSSFATTVKVEVASFFGPKNHVRPDWFIAGSPEVVFTGDETSGK